MLRRIAVLLVGVIWFQMAMHSAMCHDDSGPGQHTETESECSCECHTPTGPVVHAEFRMPQQFTWLPFHYMAPRGTFVPTDIFRPPLANS